MPDKKKLNGQNTILHALANCLSLVLLGSGTEDERKLLLQALQTFMSNADQTSEPSAFAKTENQEAKIQQLYADKEASWHRFLSLLSIRAQKVILRGIPGRGEHIGSFEQLLAYSESDLLLFQNCGPITVNEIKKRLKEFGLELKSEPR